MPTSELADPTLVEDEPTVPSVGWDQELLTIPERVGPYRIEGELGHGGMSVVFRGIHEESGERVAVKVVRSPNTMNLAALRREITSLRRLDHPNVVKVIDTGVDQGRPWYSMPLLEGPTLRAHMLDKWRSFAEHDPADWEEVTHNAFATNAGSSGRQAVMGATAPADSNDLPFNRAVDEAKKQLQEDTGSHPSAAGNLPEARPRPPASDAPRHAPPAAAGDLRAVLRIFKSLCDTLAVVHGEGLVHRDLKPENVILSGDQKPTLVDFGLIASFGARETRESIEGEFQLAGTPGYMAPEQILQELVDARADLYALGCMLYEALTRRRPFGAAKGLDLVQRQLYESPRAPSSWARGIPPELDALTLRLLERHPQRRVGHASDAAEVLRRVLGDPAEDSNTQLRHYLYRPTLAGRLEVLADLEGRMSQSENGPARLCLIGGPSGMGKTRLAVEVMAATARRRLKVFHGECLPLTAGTRAAIGAADESGDFVRDGLRGAPLHPFRPFLRAVADICTRDGATTTDELVGDRLPVLAAYAPELRRAPGAIRHPRGPGLSDEAGQRRVLSDLAETLQALADRAPFLLVLDDIQWADPLSMAFLIALAEGELEIRGMMLLCTYRNEALSPSLIDLVSACGKDAFEIGPLERDAVSSMIEDMLASEAVPEPFVDYLSRASSGNPFFIAQYLRTAVEEKLLRRRISGEWVVDPQVVDSDADLAFDSLPLPNSVEQLVLHRVARLSPAARQVLDAASVLARDFDADALLDLSEVERDSVLDALAELLEQGVIATADDATFTFSHDKVRELSYRGLSETRRTELHARAASSLAGRLEGADAMDSDPGLLPLLADHYLAAGDRPRGARYLVEAGRAALAAHAPASAAPFLARALEVVNALGAEAVGLPRIEHARLERDYAWARYCTGDVKDYLDHSHRALELLGHGTPTSKTGWAWSALAEFTRHCLYGVLPKSWLRADDEEQRERLRLSAETAAGLSWGYIYGNSPPRALGLSLVAANLSHRAGALGPRAVPYTMLGATWGSFGLSGLADRYFETARESSSEVDVIGQAFVQRWIESMHHFNFARWERGLELVEEVLEQGRTSGDAHAMVNSLSILSIAAYHRGELEACTRYAAEARELARANAYAVLETVTRCQLAAVHLHHGRADRALPLLADRSGVDESVEGVMTLITRRAIQAGALMQSGRHREALRAADAAVELLEANPAGNMTSIMAHYWLPSVYLDAMRIARERNEPEQALMERARLTLGWARRFARMYPIGRPLELRHRAHMQALLGDESASTRLHARAADEAARLEMSEELRLNRGALTAPGAEHPASLPAAEEPPAAGPPAPH